MCVRSYIILHCGERNISELRICYTLPTLVGWVLCIRRSQILKCIRFSTHGLSQGIVTTPMILYVTEDKDDDFELTAEMLIHGNADDEGTLEEEEMLEELEDEGSSGELTDLQKVNCWNCVQCTNSLIEQSI